MWSKQSQVTLHYVPMDLTIKWVQELLGDLQQKQFLTSPIAVVQLNSWQKERDIDTEVTFNGHCNPAQSNPNSKLNWTAAVLTPLNLRLKHLLLHWGRVTTPVS